MANENGNGTVSKLTNLRLNFLSDINDARERFVNTIKSLREAYISQVVDVTMGDPGLNEVERALSNWKTSAQVAPFPVAAPTAAPEGPAATMVSIGQSGQPEKFPMKTVRGLTVYGRCPGCNSYVLEPGAKFCSHCAYPLDEAFPR